MLFEEELCNAHRQMTDSSRVVEAQPMVTLIDVVNVAQITLEVEMDLRPEKRNRSLTVLACMSERRKSSRASGDLRRRGE